MKKIISLALSLVLVSSAFAGSCLSARETADGAATQKIGLICSDPGFESGELTTGVPATDGGMGAWNEQQKKEFNAGLSITDEDAATGRYSLKVMTPTWSSNFALGFNVEKNTVYALSFKIKTVGPNGGLWSSQASMKIMKASISADNKLSYENITNNQVINDIRRTGWQQRYLTFNSGDTTLVHMFFGSDNGGLLQKESTMYLDDISLEEIADSGIIEPLANGSGFEETLETFVPVMSGSGTMPSWDEAHRTEYKGGVGQSAEFDEKTNLLSNGSFDNKDWWATDWWYCTTGWWGFGKELNGDDGTNCLHIKEVWQGVHYGTSFEAKPYTNYNVTFIYKGNPRWAHARILTMDEKIIADKNVDGNVNLTEWKNFTMSFNSGSEGGKCIFTFVMEPDSEFYVDDVYITPLETNKITVSDSCLSVSVNSAEPGAAVKITAAPETGRRVKSIVLTGDENAGIINADNTVKGIKTVFDSDTGFTMPGYDVTVSAEYTDYTDYNRDGVTDIRDLIRLKKLIAADSGYKNAAEELAMLRKILLGAA